MPLFRTLIRGERFLIESEGQIKLLGFYTTRFVEASDPEDAEYKAVDLIRNDQALRECIRNTKSDPPTMFVEKIDELEQGEELPSNTGYTFFPGDE